MSQTDMILEEVLAEINAALTDAKGIDMHQRRLSFSLSLGAATLLEIYLKKKEVLKPGIKMNHAWLKKSIENIKSLLKEKVTLPLENLSALNNILEKAHAIEKERDQLAYGKKVSENIIREKINIFLDLKKEVENA